MLDAAETLRYRPSRLARNWRTKSTNTIAFVIPDIENDFFISLARRIEEVAFRAGYTLLLCNTDDNLQRETAHFGVLRDEMVAGIILCPTDEDSSGAEANKLIQEGISIVAVDRLPEGIQVDIVLSDNFSGSRRAVSYLIETGHRRIGLIAGPDRYAPGRERRLGYEQALLDSQLPIDPDLIKITNFKILIPTNPDYYQNFVWYPFLWMAGGEVVNEEFTEARINSPTGAQALGFWGDLVNEHQVAPTTSTGQNPVDERFPTGRAAMYVSGYWVYGWIQANYPDFLPNLDVVTIPPPEPGGESSTVYGGWTVMVYNNTQFPEQAAEFAINLSGAEDLSRNVQWNTVLNTKLSPRQSLREEANEFYSSFRTTFSSRRSSRSPGLSPPIHRRSLVPCGKRSRTPSSAAGPANRRPRQRQTRSIPFWIRAKRVALSEWAARRPL